MAEQQGNPEVFNLGTRGGFVGSKTLTNPELIKSVVLATDGVFLHRLCACAQYILYHAPNVEVLTLVNINLEYHGQATDLLVVLSSRGMPELKLRSIQFIWGGTFEHGEEYVVSRMDPEEKWQLPARADGYRSYSPLVNVRTLALPDNCVVDGEDDRFCNYLDLFSYKTEVCSDCTEHGLRDDGFECTDCSYATWLETLIVQMNTMRSTEDRLDLIDVTLRCGIPNVIFRGRLAPQRRELYAALTGPSTVRYLETDESPIGNFETYERVAGELFDDKKFPLLLRWGVAQPNESNTMCMAYTANNVRQVLPIPQTLPMHLLPREQFRLTDAHAQQLMRRIHVKFAVPMLAMYALAIKMTTVNHSHALCNSLTSAHSGIMQTICKFAFPVNMGLMPKEEYQPPKWSIRTMTPQQEWRDLACGIPDIGRIGRFVNNSLYIKNELFGMQAAMQIVVALRHSGRKRKPARE